MSRSNAIRLLIVGPRAMATNSCDELSAVACSRSDRAVTTACRAAALRLIAARQRRFVAWGVIAIVAAAVRVAAAACRTVAAVRSRAAAARRRRFAHEIAISTMRRVAIDVDQTTLAIDRARRAATPAIGDHRLVAVVTRAARALSRRRVVVRAARSRRAVHGERVAEAVAVRHAVRRVDSAAIDVVARVGERCTIKFVLLTLAFHS
jgi:hypothetical protein